MLMQETLARDRMREAERAAAQRRLARRLVSARRWRRAAQWTDRRARRAVAAL